MRLDPVKNALSLCVVLYGPTDVVVKSIHMSWTKCLKSQQQKHGVKWKRKHREKWNSFIFEFISQHGQKILRAKRKKKLANPIAFDVFTMWQVKRISDIRTLTTPKICKNKKKTLQKCCCYFLFLLSAVDGPVLVPAQNDIHLWSWAETVLLFLLSFALSSFHSFICCPFVFMAAFIWIHVSLSFYCNASSKRWARSFAEKNNRMERTSWMDFMIRIPILLTISMFADTLFVHSWMSGILG